MNSLTIAIRANGGDVVGMGHIRRCLTLAQALSLEGAAIYFIINSDKTTAALIAENGFDVEAIESKDDFEETRKAVSLRRAAALIIDSYDVDAQYLSRIREHLSLLAIIDDVADRTLPVDLVINGAVYAPRLRYDVLPNTNLLLGSDYAILRKEFAQEVERQFAGPAQRILITVGGSDPTGLTRNLIDWVREEHESALLDIVIGPFFRDADLILELAKRIPNRIRAHVNPADMRSLMLNADLAITGGGQTTYELAAAGTPALAIATADHQLQNVRGLAEAGTLVYAGRADDPELKADLINLLRELIGNTEKRRLMSQRGRALIDGKGANRLAVDIIKQCRRRAPAEVVGISSTSN